MIFGSSGINDSAALKHASAENFQTINLIITNNIDILYNLQIKL